MITILNSGTFELLPPLATNRQNRAWKLVYGSESTLFIQFCCRIFPSAPQTLVCVDKIVLCNFFSEKVVHCFRGGSILPSECVQIGAPVTFEALACDFTEDQQKKNKF